MKLKNLMVAGALTAVMSAPAFAVDSLSAEQKKEVEKTIHDYLINNPEILIEASQALQQKQQQSMQEQAKTAITENANELFTEKLAVAGNPNGKVTLVEFFDYQCIHCKKMQPIISDLIKKNADLKVIYKEFPIFGQSSELASEAALAAAMQNRYQSMHDALLKEDKHLDETIIMDIAKSVGLDMDKLKKDMKSQTVQNALESNRKLAENMHLMGTPAFVIAATPDGKLKKNSNPAFIPGAASEDALQNLIKQEAVNKPQ